MSLPYIAVLNHFPFGPLRHWQTFTMKHDISASRIPLSVPLHLRLLSRYLPQQKHALPRAADRRPNFCFF